MALTLRCLSLSIVAYQNMYHTLRQEIKRGTFHMESHKFTTELCSPHDGKDDGSQYDRLLHNQLRNAFDNQKQKIVTESIFG